MKKHLLYISLLCFAGNLSFGQAAGDYRSVASGTWATIANWQTFSGGAWIAAAAAPNSGSNVITIQSPNVINIAASVTADQIVVDPGATLSTTGGAGVVLTLANGAGVDLLVNGTFQESATGNISWTAGATWQMGANGTLIKTSVASSNNWQLNYQGGIATIPSTSFWIIRRNSAVNIPLSTTTPGTGSVYPNLTIENNVAGTWVTPNVSSFTGNTAFPTIKGNLDIGGSGTSTVDFLNSNTNASPALVNGNVIIRAGNTLRNYGTGFEIQGNLTVSGTVNYDANDARTLTFSGSNPQSINGAGTLNIYGMTMNKSSGALTLNRAITIDNLLTFTSGIIYSSALNLLTISSTASVASASNSSFVSGPVRYTGVSAFTFPVGKGSDYQALSMSASSAPVTFWTEAFQNGCSSGCLASSYTGPNGTWSVTFPGANSPAANLWYISGAECGNASGACGSTCTNVDPSLHIGANDGFVVDAGASYDAGGGCPSFYCVTTSTRAESPTINCTGYSNIQLNFNYIENGSGSTDNATVWYFDGTSWAQIDDPAKVTLCGAQGTWTNRTITLPSTADNNPNVKIGFMWVNNDDGLGTDPSFAVDDITLSVSTIVDFTCEYFYNNPQAVYGNLLVPSLDHISSCEYWILTRNAGTENKNVTLTWDGNSCGVTLLSDLRVARYDGISTWQNEGNTSTTGTTASGTVTSVAQTAYGPYTLASSSAENPLPVELLDFAATYNNKDAVDLKWKTASETNNDYFTVERSADAIYFNDLLRIRGSGNSSHITNYSCSDKNPLGGMSYYRLRQTDFNGVSSYSNVIPVNIERNDFDIVNVYNSAEKMIDITVNCSGNCTVNFELYNALGVKVYSSVESTEGEHSHVFIPASSFDKGIYFLKARNSTKQMSRKIVL